MEIDHSLFLVDLVNQDLQTTKIDEESLAPAIHDYRSSPLS
jgi:hypothetical protein